MRFFLIINEMQEPAAGQDSYGAQAGEYYDEGEADLSHELEGQICIVPDVPL